MKRFLLETLRESMPAGVRIALEGYKNLYFPFEEIPAPQFAVRRSWNLDRFLNYYETWASVKKYAQELGVKPRQALAPVGEALKAVWKDSGKTPINLTWDLALKVGRKGSPLRL